jgi:hypothetical protein
MSFSPWTGMRGVVTLARRAGTPLVVAGRRTIPRSRSYCLARLPRDHNQLLVSGTDPAWLIGRLKLDDPDHDSFVVDQRARAEAITRAATNQALDDYAKSHSGPDAERLVAIMRQRFHSEQKMERPIGIDPDAAMALGKVLLERRRRSLVNARDSMELDDHHRA